MPEYHLLANLEKRGNGFVSSQLEAWTWPLLIALFPGADGKAKGLTYYFY